MWEFLVGGGPIMILLVVTSIAGVTFIVERAIALRWQKVMPRQVVQAVDECDPEEGVEPLKAACYRFPSTLSRLLLVTTSHRDWPKTENADALQVRARQEVVKLERGLVVLEIVVGIAPLLGLVGTIHGLIRLFSGLSDLGQADSAMLAQGIAIALNTTLVGLLIAIPSLVAWNYFNKKVETMAVELENLCDGFLRRLYRSRQETHT